jgi:succinate-semialdehyde dehydrogenase / glutarate-semialdehyde dehydrogenase
MTFVGIPSLPFGGVGDSGFGRFHGDDGLREFSRPKATTRKKFSMGREMQEFPRTKQQFTIVRRVLKLKFARRWGR